MELRAAAARTSAAQARRTRLTAMDGLCNLHISKARQGFESHVVQRFHGAKETFALPADQSRLYWVLGDERLIGCCRTIAPGILCRGSGR
jgi:hypothetical protein